MVITLEPGITMPDGSVLVHEDNFVITAHGARQLSPAAPRELWVI
jgi:Xaa-Pro aminopeptidase